MAFPTEARLRAEALERAGHTAVKRKQVVEDHCDDCGESLSGLEATLHAQKEVVSDTGSLINELRRRLSLTLPDSLTSACSLHLSDSR